MEAANQVSEQRHPVAEVPGRLGVTLCRLCRQVRSKRLLTHLKQA
jgi:hypothetical protein